MSTQALLQFDTPRDHPQERARVRHTFDGSTFDSELDGERLSTQLDKVFDLMRDGEWRTLGVIARLIGASSEPGVSARLRDLRKERFGAHQVERRRVEGEDGLWEYRLIAHVELLDRSKSLYRKTKKEHCSEDHC